MPAASTMLATRTVLFSIGAGVDAGVGRALLTNPESALTEKAASLTIEY